ncbi:MAG: NHL repeat-containing protein [Bacteroidota bacterium]
MLRTVHQKCVTTALLLLLAGSAVAQPVDQEIRVQDLEAVAFFEEAVAVDIDPAGVVYVVDAGAHHIAKISAEGKVLQHLGGPGEGEGQFDTPADVDVTNGLVLVVADAANGRVQRFSREFLFLESLNIDDDANARQDVYGSEPSYRQQAQDGNNIGSGRPISLITADDNAMYVVDEVENAIQMWDAQRNFVRQIGAYDQGEGSLIEPVAVALSDAGGLFIADRGRNAIVVYDAFGGFDRTMADGLIANAESLFILNDLLLVILHDRLLVYQSRGLLESTIAIALDEPLRDAAIHNGVLYLLGEKTLFKTSWATLAP